MTIADMREKSKALLAKTPRDVLIVGVLIVASMASFALGYLTGVDVSGQGSEASKEASTAPIHGGVVASKAGTKYYRPECPGVDRISDDNRVWYASADLARNEGYEPAANCDGL